MQNRSIKVALEAAKAHLSSARLSRALLGADIPSPSAASPPNLPCDPADLDTLLAQLAVLHEMERDRAAENRRRSEQLAARLFAALPLTAALAAYGLSRANRWSWCVAGLLALAAAVAALLATLGIMNNLGKENWYAPLALRDLRRDQAAWQPQYVPASKPLLIAEHITAIQVNERRVDDCIDRLHTAHALLVLAILLGSVAAAVSAASVVTLANPGSPDGQRVDGGVDASAVGGAGTPPHDAGRGAEGLVDATEDGASTSGHPVLVGVLPRVDAGGASAGGLITRLDAGPDSQAPSLRRRSTSKR